MSSTLLNISGRIDAETVVLYENVRKATSQLNIPFVVVGASARDIVLHYCHGAPIQRATTDIDFGIEVPDWNAFNALKEILLGGDFDEAPEQHRIISSGNVPVDIIPFGQVEDEESNIAWPPDEGWIMNVLGFQEACDNAETVRIQNRPPIDIPVATPKGMAILKLIAWTDRTADKRGRDATDLLYLFTTYEKIPEVNRKLFEDPAHMEMYDWDIEVAGAHQLGIDAEGIATDQTYSAIANLFNNKHKKLSIERLIEEMYTNYDYQRNEELMNAFIAGFLRKDDQSNFKVTSA